MSTYCITFRIADQTVNGKSYVERRAALVEAAHRDNDGYWEETTSFILAGSALDTDTFAKRVVRPLSSAHDMAVIFDPADMSACGFGKIENFDVLRSFFPKLKKLP